MTAQKGAFWLKEYPDALGGDILGFFPGCSDVKASAGTGFTRPVHVLRTQVKTGTQTTLAQGRGCRASNDAASVSLQNFSRAETVRSSTQAALEAQNKAVALAITGCLGASLLKPRPRHLTVAEHFPTWASNFDRACQLFETQVAFALATTHALSGTKRRQLTSRGVTVLGADDLQNSWGAVGVVGAQHGILPFAAPPMEEPAGAADTEAGAEREALDRLFDTPEYS